MRAQMTKNAVIVPAGAKGGFYLKHPPAGRDALKQEVERQYVRFIGGLLELTDNLVEGEVVHPERRARARRGRHLPRRRRRQGHRDVLRHRQPDQRGARLLARRRVRLGRLERLRPQGARDHRARGVGVGQAPLLRARRRRRDRAVHRRRHRRHVGRRVRQRDAAVGPDPARRRLRPPARLPRSRPGSRRRLRRAQAAVRAGRLLLGRLRPRRDLGGRRRLAAHREVDPALAAGARGARRRGRAAGADRPDPGDPARAGRPALERRHRHGRQGVRRDRRRRDGPRIGRDPRRRERPALPRRRRGRQPRADAPRARRVRARGRADQRRLHRQLGRRRLLRPRGQPEDPARPRRAARRARPRRRATRCCAR